MTQIYCKPYRFNVDIETCKSRLEIINKEYKRHGLETLNKDQKKCLKCQGNPDVLVETEELICIGCGAKASEVSKFYPRLKKCNCCYQKDYRKKSDNVDTASEVRI